MARAQPATILFPDDVDGTVRERNPAEYEWHSRRIGFRKVARVVSAKLGRLLEMLGVVS